MPFEPHVETDGDGKPPAVFRKWISRASFSSRQGASRTRAPIVRAGSNSPITHLLDRNEIANVPLNRRQNCCVCWNRRSGARGIVHDAAREPWRVLAATNADINAEASRAFSAGPALSLEHHRDPHSAAAGPPRGTSTLRRPFSARLFEPLPPKILPALTQPRSGSSRTRLAGKTSASWIMPSTPRADGGRQRCAPEIWVCARQAAAVAAKLEEMSLDEVESI